jgi:hypothetical protein
MVDDDFIEKSLTNRIDTLETTLNNRIDTLESSVNNRFNTLEATMNNRFDAAEASVNNRFSIFSLEMKLQFEKMNEKLQHLLVISEEEHTRNHIVMDHLNMLYARQDKFEIETRTSLKNIESAIKGI